MKHIIDTDELEKLPQYATFQSYDGSLTIHAEEEYVKMSELHALIASSPQADDENAPPDVYYIAVDTGDGIYYTAEVVHFQQRGSKRMIQVRLGEPKTDDARKDAEREWTENDGNHESSKKLANRMGRIDVKFRSGFVAKDYSPNDFDFSQSGSDHDITAFRPHKFEKAIDKARE